MPDTTLDKLYPELKLLRLTIEILAKEERVIIYDQFKPDLSVLPPAQKKIWNKLTGSSLFSFCFLF